MEKTSLFIKIDEFIFQKLDLLKSEGISQKFNDAISGLDEDQQKIIAQVTTFTFILVPFIFVAILWFGNAATKKSIADKKQIIEQIALFDGNKTALNNISANYLASSAIASQNEMDNKLRNLLSQNAIDQSKVVITNFHQTSTSSSVGKIEADITFKNFGTSDFSNFMRGLMEGERFKILKVDLTKNKETNLLRGSITLMHMGQNPIGLEQAQ
ncbi:MAG: hypothetical protein H7336_00680 [Bacteriovorax sp.]|nr:hypothetical protein [Bacteriovorax sp.]